VDLVKSKIQSMKVVNGVPEYSGAFDVVVKTVKNEGFFKLWKGNDSHNKLMETRGA